jgi:hypothetical protein
MDGSDVIKEKMWLKKDEKVHRKMCMSAQFFVHVGYGCASNERCLEVITQVSYPKIAKEPLVPQAKRNFLR